jgi:hypothetical protein
VRRIPVQDTRRTCGSLLAALDVHPRMAVAILCHSRIAITMKIYTQIPDKATRDALRRLSDELGERVPAEEAAADVDGQDDEPGGGGAGGPELAAVLCCWKGAERSRLPSPNRPVSWRARRDSNPQPFDP